jgi:murein DD-endopeptidase MepM/ murein hydrolase activator NlpD
VYARAWGVTPVTHRNPRAGFVSQFSVRRFIAMTLALAAVAPAAAHAQGFDTLSRGDRGDAVRVVQRALTQVGIRTTADGVFGRRTARNVRRYERREELAVDGRVSRGQARGLLRRAGMDPAIVDRGAPATQARAAGGPGAGTAFPVQGEWTWGDGFGARGGGHDGVDVMSACGTPLIAPEAGRVVFTGSHAAAGNYLVVRVASGEDHVFMHLQAAPPHAKGAEIAAGARLGAVGDSGNASACHLHFEIWTAPGWYEGGAARDPKPDLERWAAS